VKRNEELFALYMWLQDWTDTARAVIVRRDLLIRLGIGKRRPRRSAAVVTPVPPPVAPPAAPSAPVAPG